MKSSTAKVHDADFYISADVDTDTGEIKPAASRRRKKADVRPLRIERYEETEEKTHWPGWVLAVALLFMVIAAVSGAGYYLRQPTTLPIKEVKIKGEFLHLSKRELEQRTIGLVSGGFFSMDLDVIKEAAEELEWVAKADIRRVWPDGININVVEHEAIARWGDDALISRAGEQFQPRRSSIPENLPVLKGPEGSMKKVIEQFRKIEKQLSEINLSAQTLMLDNQREWEMTLSNGIVVELGKQDVSERTERFVDHFQAALSAGKGTIERVDMRYTNGFSVAWVDAGTTETKASQRTE